MPMTDRITIRMPQELLERIDTWIASQPGYVSRQEVVRQFIDEGLAARDLAGPASDEDRHRVSLEAVASDG